MFRALLLVIRTLLTLMGALALLYVLSYPDSILPPTPNIEYVTEFSLYDIKPVIWLIPLLFMEFTSGCGSHRDGVWFFSLFSVLLAGVIAWPVLQANVPEWVHPTLPFEDGKLAEGLGWFALITSVSFIFRRVLVDYLFREPRREEEDPTMMEPTLLDPSKAMTVRQIAANPIKVQPRFRFGEADHELIGRFFALVRRLALQKRQRRVVEALALVAVALWFFYYPQPTEQEALQRDMAAMYEHVDLPQGGSRATHRAVHAAYRVLKHVADHELLAGMTFREAEKYLQISRAPAAYRKQLLDSSDISLPSVDDIFESRTRFFTVQDGRRTVVLYVRTNQEGDRINISEVQDAGWNAVMDDRRRRFGADVSKRFFTR